MRRTKVDEPSHVLLCPLQPVSADGLDGFEVWRGQLTDHEIEYPGSHVLRQGTPPWHAMRTPDLLRTAKYLLCHPKHFAAASQEKTLRAAGRRERTREELSRSSSTHQ